MVLTVESKTKSNTEDKNSIDDAVEIKTNKLVTLLLQTTNTPELFEETLKKMQKEITSASKSMISIPKPLKYLYKHYNELANLYTKAPKTYNTALLADILSCIAMIHENEDDRLCVKYKLLSLDGDISMWGHEYIKHLSRELIKEFIFRVENDQPTESLDALVYKIVNFEMQNRAETDAIDLLLEVDLLEKIIPLVEKDNVNRICDYLMECNHLISDSSDKILSTIFALYLNHSMISDAFITALQLKDKEKLKQCLNHSATDKALMMQLSLILGMNKNYMELMEENSDFMALAGNEKLSSYFNLLSTELNVTEHKRMEDIYKSNIIDRSTFKKKKNSSENKIISSSRENLATLFANAFVHSGFCSDPLMSTENSDWIYKSKDSEMISATASLGLIHLWDLDNGFQAIDRFTECPEVQIRAGAILAAGIIGCGINSEMDASFALLADALENESPLIQLYSVIGLGISFAGTARKDILELLSPFLLNPSGAHDISIFAAISIGLIFAGSCDEDACGNLLEAILCHSSSKTPQEKLLMISLGIALLYLGAKKSISGLSATLPNLKDPNSKDSQWPSITLRLVTIFAYCDSGDIACFQSMLESILELTSEEKSDAKEEFELEASICIIGLALISLRDSISREHCCKILDDLLRYEGKTVRRAIPLAFALLFISRPSVNAISLLTKLSHDSDEPTALSAILALGLVGAGSNNSRISKALRSLAIYYSKDANLLFLTRISQGLVHCGKGLMSLNPHLFDSKMSSTSAISGLLVVILSSLDMRNGILADKSFLLYYLALAMKPRMLMTISEDGDILRVPVRVGKALDSQRNPSSGKSIAGFQIHSTPVLLGSNERAELGSTISRKYIPLSSVLEGVVVLRNNPNFDQDMEEVDK